MYYVYHIKRQNMTINEGYIGITTNFRTRKNSHYSDLKNNKHVNMLLQRAWNKHKDLEIVLIHSVETYQEMVDLEIKYRPTPNIGWNIKSGGNTYIQHSEQTKRKIANCQLGRSHSEESKKKMSASAKDRPANRKGATLSDATKLKLRNANLGKSYNIEVSKKKSASSSQYKEAVLWINVNGQICFCPPWELPYIYPHQKLTANALGKVFVGEYKQHKGWYLYE